MSTLMIVIRKVSIEKVKKQLRKLPRHIVDKLQFWVTEVESKGVEEVRKQPGWHDEPLKGDRAGQRSIRLSKGYRAFYEIVNNETVVSVIEVNKHDY